MDLSGIRKNSNHGDNSQTPSTRIQIFCPLTRLPEPLRPMLYRKDMQCSWVLTYDAVEKNDLLSEFNLVVIYPGPVRDVEEKRRLGRFLQTAQKKSLPIILMTEDETLANFIPLESDQLMPRVQVVDPDVTTEELWGRVYSMLNFSPVFDRIEMHMSHLEKWAFALNNRFEELHKELRLAWRVQQEFLPKKLPNTPEYRFATLYRPATWVSGDIYDIFKLDEKHIGFYLADVVGHGVAAGLMTLFVKRALVTKEILGSSYHLLETHQALARLNDDICSLELPEHQFVTSA